LSSTAQPAGLIVCAVMPVGAAAVISQHLQQYHGRLAICPPKIPDSSRVIALDHTTIAAPRGRRDRQRAEAGAYGRDSERSGSCPPTSTGTRWPLTG
jgi:hypothetical protein